VDEVHGIGMIGEVVAGVDGVGGDGVKWWRVWVVDERYLLWWLKVVAIGC
jgi:hypothetical protein